MAKVETATKLALDVPRSPIGLTFELLDLWGDVLGSRGFEVTVLPRQDEADSRKILSGVGGLVIACYNTRAIQLDEDNIIHMSQAEGVGIPIFVQAEDWSEVAPAVVDSPPGETIFIGSKTSMIRERLGE